MTRKPLLAALMIVASCSAPLDDGGTGGTGGTGEAGTGGTGGTVGTGGTGQGGRGGMGGEAGSGGIGGYGLGGSGPARGGTSGAGAIAGRGGAGGAGGDMQSLCGQVLRSSPYQLVRARNLAAPLPDPVGITFDGQMLWIMGGAYSPPDTTATLVRFDPDRLTVDRTFTFDNLMETAGSGVYGITWDGAAIWISVGGDRNKLVKIDPATGQITRTMSSPSDLGPIDLDFFDGTLWLSSGTGTIFALDPKTGGIDYTVSVPGGFSGRDDGIAVRAGEVWIGALFGGMCVEDPMTGAPLAQVVHDNGTQLIPEEIGASVFIGSQLVTATGRGITYYDIR